MAVDKTKNDDPMMHNIRMRRDTFKDKKLTKHFIEKLLKKMEVPSDVVARCLKIPAKHYAIIMNLINQIVNGKYKLDKLKDLKDLMCPELKMIPQKLKDAKIVDHIKLYLKLHVKSFRN
jgi:hypothetical protein